MGLSRRYLVMCFVLLMSRIDVVHSVNPTMLLVKSSDISAVDGTECNTTLYSGWYDIPYSGGLLDDLNDFWRFSDAELTNGHALDAASSACKVMMKTLRLDRAGRNGPVADKYIYDVMCAKECVLSDSLREKAMLVTGCTCLQLSTQPSEAVYDSPGDWCTANSGRILCETFDHCGLWNCRISDFMCPRYEYNKKDIRHRGKGDCSRASRTAKRLLVTTVLVTSASAVVLYKMFLYLK